MADGGQRLLDVIDDPNALESFLGGLTADSELLPSAETVDNVVASLARSLDENEYEVDSPNETLFDTLDSSSNHLTDISRSYVPSDFGPVTVHSDGFSSGLDGFSNGGGGGMRGSLQQHEHQQTPVGSSGGGDQYGGVSTNNTISSVMSASSVSNITTVTASSNLKQIAASVSNCDPSKSSSHYVQSGHLQLTQNSVPSSVSNNLNFVFSQDLQQKHNIASISQNQLNQVTSLSSVSVEGNIQQSIPSNSTNNLISSVVGSGNENGVVGTLTDATSNFQLLTNTQSGHVKAQNLLSNTSANIQVTSGSSSVSNVSVSNDTNAASVSSNSTLSSNASVSSVVGSSANTTANQSQFITNASTHQTTVNQLVSMSGQTVSIPSMTVSAAQMMSQGSLVAATAGQNILQQIQSVGSSQSYIAMEQPTALIATGPTTFGTANVALVATGGTPTYAMLPTTQQFLTNAIIPQSHTLQSLTKTSNGAYFQTTAAPQIVATSNVNALQNVSVANATSDAHSSTIVKPKQPPQLLPKPLSQVNTTVTTNASSVTTPPVSSATNSTDGASGVQQTSLPVTSSSTANTAVTDGVVTQLIHQSQQQLSNVGGSSGTVSITPQQSYTIGNAGSLGQVVVSQVGSLSTMTAPQQTQLSGTIVVNQYGQPMLLPNASTAQAGALQLILRQQPTQPQVLTIQTPTGAATLNAQAANATGKPIVRYVSQVPQLAQTSGYGLQQIQTPNGPAWVAVRYPQVSQASQFAQIQTESIVSPSATLQGQIANSQSQLQIQNQQTQQVQIQLQQQQNQLIQQSHQQQQQIHLQNQSHMQVQQQIQLQGATQLSAQSQQLSLASQQQGMTATQSGQISNAQHVHQQTQQAHGVQMQASQSFSQSAISNEPQNNLQAQQNQYLNRQNEMFNNQSQTQAQHAHEMEQQQISVPDSSSEPPPPKKAKTKSKSSKKKVTLDLEQLLKQSGIMDEDLNDDMSFDFGFMDMQPNGLPPSPQLPPAQIPVINTTETPKKGSSKKSKSNAKKSPATPLPPPPPPVSVITTPSPSAKPTKKRSSPKKKKASTPPPPPQPLPPPPPPFVMTPTKSKSGGSKKKSGSVNDSQKPETKTTSSKKTAPPKKISSLDTLLATIDAVAAAAGASSASSPFQKCPSPPPSLPTPPRKPTPSPKNKGSKSKSAAKNSMHPAPSPAKTETPTFSVSSAPTNAPPMSSLSHLPLSTPGTTIPQSAVPQNVSVAVPSLSPSLQTPSSINSVAPSSPHVTGPSLTNGSSTATTTNSGVTRVVQTIQLTPQNQQLLRNIQSQIQRLCALPKRSETEQSALQKLVVLQQQVIATGIPVPNPAHLNNLAQSVNVESINLTTPSATVPSSDTATASPSSAISPLFPFSESDFSTNPVSSTVTTATMPTLAQQNVVNSTKLNSSNPSTNGCSPVPNTLATANVGSSYGAGIVGSPSVSSTASPDSTSNLAISLGYDQTSSLPPSTLSNTGNATATSVNSGGVGSILVSNVNADLGQLVASVSVASAEDKHKENTQGKGSYGATTTVPVTSTNVISSASLSQHHLPPTSSYMSSSFTTRTAAEDKRMEEQRSANLKAEEEKRARWKKEEFEMLLQRDQQYVVKPDYEVPFPTKKDAVERLMKYHIYRDRNDMNFEEFDAEFGNNAGILLEKFSVMMFKYRNLLLKESMKEVGCAERVMLERMFVSEEKVRLEQDRLLVAQGDVLELPPPPESWIPKVKEMVDKEMMEFEPQDPVVSQQVQSAVDSIIGCESNDTSSYMMEEGEKIEYDAFGVPINSSGYAGLNSASSADIDEAVRSILS